MKSLLRTTLHGSFGFAAVSVAAYSIWAFVPRTVGGEKGMYALIALVYLGGAGLAMSGLLQGENRLRRFYRMFLPAFFGYALLWSVAWFLIKEPPGGWRLREWIGAAAGTLFFSWVCWNSLKKPAGFWHRGLGTLCPAHGGLFHRWKVDVWPSWQRNRGLDEAAGRHRGQTGLGIVPWAGFRGGNRLCTGVVATADAL
jgi:hypothetical protein